jgi:diguanylate cyclase (GGDEF)-like protein
VKTHSPTSSSRYLIQSLPSSMEDHAAHGAAPAALHATHAARARAHGLDPLTGLLTEEPFRQRAQDNLTAWAGATGVLLRLDLDHFVRVNTLFGFSKGDLLLQQITARLRSVAGENDLLARLAQDEFVLLVGEISHASVAARLARQILGVISRPILVEGRAFYLTASLGAVIFRDETEIDGLLEQAEFALVKARLAGRNTHCLVEGDAKTVSSSVSRADSEIRKALVQSEFFLVYQPVLTARTREIISVEALLRWRHPEAGVLTPAQFMPAAERAGIMTDIGEWVLNHACSQIKQWSDLGLADLALSINFSATQLRSGKLAALIDGALSANGVPAAALSVEFNAETIASADAILRRALHEVGEVGARLSLDNLAGGFFAPAQLVQLPFGSFKIDRSVVAEVAVDQRAAALVKALSILGKSHDLNVDAEGVETEEQLTILNREGCDHVQGFLLARPQEPRQILELLREPSPPLLRS